MIELELPPVKRRAVSYPALKPGSPEWKEKRPKLLGASEVSALFGVLGDDHYKSPYQIYLEKTGKTEEEPRAADSPASIGSELELSIARIYQRVKAEDGVGAIQKSWTEHDEILPYFAATPDYDCFDTVLAATDRSHTVQVKNRGGWPEGWGEPGTDEIPRSVLIQVHAELTVTQKEFEDVAVLLSGNRFAWYRVHRSDDVSANIRDVVRTFWETHILADEPPAIEGSGVNEYFNKKFAVAVNEVVRFAEKPEEIEAMGDYQVAHEVFKASELDLENAKAVMKSIIGSSKGIEEHRIGKILWFNTSGRRTISEVSLRKALRAFNGTEKQGVAILDQAQIEEIVAGATTKGEDFRTFKFTAAK